MFGTLCFLDGIMKTGNVSRIHGHDALDPSCEQESVIYHKPPDGIGHEAIEDEIKTKENNTPLRQNSIAILQDDIRKAQCAQPVNYPVTASSQQPNLPQQQSTQNPASKPMKVKSVQSESFNFKDHNHYKVFCQIIPQTKFDWTNFTKSTTRLLTFFDEMFPPAAKEREMSIQDKDNTTMMAGYYCAISSMSSVSIMSVQKYFGIEISATNSEDHNHYKGCCQIIPQTNFEG